jgi:CHASE2 domain-containing sensor protein
MRGLEDWRLDPSFVIRGKRATSSKVVLVNVDDASLDQLKKPVLYLSPELAKILLYLNEQGATAIGVDILIPQSYSALSALQKGATGDAATMGEAIQVAGSVVLPEWRVENQTLRPLIQWQFNALTEPEQHRPDFGLVNLTEDDDQCVRRQQLAVRTGDDSLALSFAFGLLARSRRASISWDPARHDLSLSLGLLP